jgi:arylsulfatase A-like enzyme/Tfp pilus assembly protein PilF
MRAHWILLAGLWLGSASLAAQSSASRDTSPDVFLITIDTLRADHVHCYGYDKIATPALDALARDGIRFGQAFTPSPVTNTSHTTILTGLLPSVHGVTDFGVPLASTHATWAELLHNRGYQTAAFIGAVILDSKTLAPGLDRGFDFYDNFPEHPKTKERWGRVERRGAEVAQHAETWLDAHRTGPRFVWVHLYDPHDPYEPPPPYSQTYKDRLYDGEIAYADSVLGTFIDYLKSHGWYRGALVIVVGDHGEGLGEHREETHGIFLYDSTLHVPLILKLPGTANAGKTVGLQVRTTDVLPTVLDLTRVELPAGLSGSSLRPFFDGTETVNRSAIGETDYPLRFGWAALKSVRRDGKKFIEAPRPEFYDLHADPGELNNLYSEANPDVATSRHMLRDLSELTHSGSEPLPPPPSGSAQPAFALPDPKDKIEEQNLLHAAMLASDDNRPDAARAALEKVLALDPKSPTALRQLGELELDAGNYAKAATYLKAAHAVRPDDMTVNLNLGKALEKTGDFAGARDALEAGLQASPGQLPARILLGNVYLALKDFRSAEDQFDAALLLQPDSAEAQAGLVKARSGIH